MATLSVGRSGLDMKLATLPPVSGSAVHSDTCFSLHHADGSATRLYGENFVAQYGQKGALELADGTVTGLERVSAKGDLLLEADGFERSASAFVKTLQGPNGLRDALFGLTRGKTEIHGGNGDDRLYGINGDDVIVGRSGKDVLYGGAGDDLLKGGGGIDSLHGGLGDDDLFGGAGKDRFVFGPDFGNDRILDLDDGEDVVVLDRTTTEITARASGDDIFLTVASEPGSVQLLGVLEDRPAFALNGKVFDYDSVEPENSECPEPLPEDVLETVLDDGTRLSLSFEARPTTVYGDTVITARLTATAPAGQDVSENLWQILSTSTITVNGEARPFSWINDVAPVEENVAQFVWWNPWGTPRALHGLDATAGAENALELLVDAELLGGNVLRAGASVEGRGDARDVTTLTLDDFTLYPEPWWTPPYLAAPQVILFDPFAGHALDLTELPDASYGLVDYIWGGEYGGYGVGLSIDPDGDGQYPAQVIAYINGADGQRGVGSELGSVNEPPPVPFEEFIFGGRSYPEWSEPNTATTTLADGTVLTLVFTARPTTYHGDTLIDAKLTATSADGINSVDLDQAAINAASTIRVNGEQQGLSWYETFDTAYANPETEIPIRTYYWSSPWGVPQALNGLNTDAGIENTIEFHVDSSVLGGGPLQVDQVVVGKGEERNIIPLTLNDFALEPEMSPAHRMPSIPEVVWLDPFNGDILDVIALPDLTYNIEPNTINSGPGRANFDVVGDPDGPNGAYPPQVFANITIYEYQPGLTADTVLNSSPHILPEDEFIRGGAYKPSFSVSDADPEEGFSADTHVNYPVVTMDDTLLI
ncbi:hypothetical protein [Marinivivus vitaminiproducens]|uniref:hypothetical protein n=1 Tax=Marinivivus vitaminiproducens TaxID=3035935 RepID=UPI0027A53988|nr:hypothetical protein P4R82_23290 [Geminicoccaceae bacterium SCSIO 64248]